MEINGDILKQYRQKRGLTQTDLAHLSGVTQSTVSRLENDCSSVAFKYLLQVLNALDLTIDIVRNRRRVVN